MDIDPIAVEATRGSVELNGCSDRCSVHLVEATTEVGDPLAIAGISEGAANFDVIVANILKPALIDLRDCVTLHLKPGGHLILSGMLPNQVSCISFIASPESSW